MKWKVTRTGHHMHTQWVCLRVPIYRWDNISLSQTTNTTKQICLLQLCNYFTISNFDSMNVKRKLLQVKQRLVICVLHVIKTLENGTQSIKWCHFQWPWMTPDTSFKVTLLFKGKFQDTALYAVLGDSWVSCYSCDALSLLSCGVRRLHAGIVFKWLNLARWSSRDSIAQNYIFSNVKTLQ